MMMPIGPTAMKVLALADVSGASQSIRMSIARFLTVSIHYTIDKQIILLTLIAFVYHHSYSIICCGRSLRGRESRQAMSIY